MMKRNRQQFHRPMHTRSPMWKVSLVVVGLSLLTVSGWNGPFSSMPPQRQRPDVVTVQAKTRPLSDTESRLQAQAAELAHLRQELERQRKELLSVISDLKDITAVQAKQLSSLQSQIQQNTRRLEDLGLAQAMVQRIAETSSASVCMIVGEYVWVDRTSGRPLRYQGMDASGEPVRWADGQARVAAGGHGPMLVRQFSGTGFLIDSAGAVLTSGYLLAPWQRDRLIQQAGYMQMIPRIRVLHAYFPGVNKPFDLRVSQVSDNGDIVICRFDPGEYKLPSLPLQRAGRRIATGEPVMLLGYPGGVDLMQARLAKTQMQEIARSGKMSDDQMAQELARRGWIQPLAIQGRISGQLNGRLFYDATTTYGGSGGPLLNSRGEVVGIEFAISPEFSGSNLAISIGSLQKWLAVSGFGTAGKSAAAGQHRQPQAATHQVIGKLNTRFVK